MHALPEIVDGARKSSQGGSWIWVGARGGGRYSSLPMLEATTSRDQCMIAVTSMVHHAARVSSAVGTTQRISGFNTRSVGGWWVVGQDLGVEVRVRVTCCIQVAS